MNEILLILAFLFVKHFIVDFYLQNNDHVAQKGNYLAYKGIEHSLQHGIGTLIILVFFIPFPFAFILGIVDFLLHYHIDWAKINLNRNQNLTPADNRFWFWLGFDQLLHSLTYLWIGWILA